MNEVKTVSGAKELLEHLQTTQSGGPSVEGFVRAVEGRIQLAPGGNCTTWLDVPPQLIERAEIDGVRTCLHGGVHTHTWARIHLKTNGDAATELLAGIIQAIASAPVERIPTFGGHLGTGISGGPAGPADMPQRELVPSWFGWHCQLMEWPWRCYFGCPPRNAWEWRACQWLTNGNGI